MDSLKATTLACVQVSQKSALKAFGIDDENEKIEEIVDKALNELYLRKRLGSATLEH